MTDTIEKRRGYVDVEHLVSELAEAIKEQSQQIHAHSLAIAVLQEQAKSGSERTSAIELAIRAIYDKIDDLARNFSLKLDALEKMLSAHTEQEDKDRIKLLLAVIATLATGLASLAFEFFKRG